MVDWLIVLTKCFVVLFAVLNAAAVLLWVERKGSALIQNRIGANRASILGVLPVNLGVTNTLLADPLKMLTKEDFVPAGADRVIHTLAPFLALFPALVTFAAIPFGDTIEIAAGVHELPPLTIAFKRPESSDETLTILALGFQNSDGS